MANNRDSFKKTIKDIYEKIKRDVTEELKVYVTKIRDARIFKIVTEVKVQRKDIDQLNTQITIVKNGVGQLTKIVDSNSEIIDNWSESFNDKVNAAKNVGEYNSENLRILGNDVNVLRSRIEKLEERLSKLDEVETKVNDIEDRRNKRMQRKQNKFIRAFLGLDES